MSQGGSLKRFRIIGALAGAGLLLAPLEASAQGMGPADHPREGLTAPCGAYAGKPLICGITNPEDLVAVAGTPWVIVGELGDRSFQRGGLKVVDRRTRQAKAIQIDWTGAASAKADESHCPGPPDQDLFSVHGLDVLRGVGAPRLYTVNHGGRESIEIFEFSVRDDKPVLTWKTCVLGPSGVPPHSLNGVAPLADGSFFVTTTIYRATPRPEFEAKLKAGAPTGMVFQWRPAKGWRTVEGSALSANNGIVVSRDGRYLFVADWGRRALARFKLSATGAILKKDVVELSFHPDNIRWSSSGDVLVTGQPAAVEQISACLRTDRPSCPADFTVERVDPKNLTHVTLVSGKGTDEFGAATSAVDVGSELWLGTFRGRGLAAVDVATFK